jgi:hypothetical protein
MIAHISLEDVKGATPEDPENCPLARCIKRCHPGNSVQVFTNEIYVNDAEFRHTADSYRFVKDFDEEYGRYGPVEIPDITSALRI